MDGTTPRLNQKPEDRPSGGALRYKETRCGRERREALKEADRMDLNLKLSDDVTLGKFLMSLKFSFPFLFHHWELSLSQPCSSDPQPWFPDVKVCTENVPWSR